MLNILSLDMIIEICKYCDYQSIYNLEYSCKEIYQLINYNTEFWKNIIINKKSILELKNEPGPIKKKADPKNDIKSSEDYVNSGIYNTDFLKSLDIK